MTKRRLLLAARLLLPELPKHFKMHRKQEHVKTVTHHVWTRYLEKCEDIIGNKEIYGLRKETIERILGAAKEQHGFRYAQYRGKYEWK